MIKKIIILSFVLYMSLGIFSNISYAQNVPKDYTLLAPLPGITTPGQTTTNIQKYLPGAFTFLLGFAGLLAFVMISWSGFQYMTTDAVFGKSQAKENLTNAIYGLVLVLASYAILYTINPKILDFNLNLQRVPASQSSTVSGSSTTGTSANGAFSYKNNRGTTVYYDGCEAPCVTVAGDLKLSTGDGISSGSNIQPQVNSGLGAKLITANSTLSKDSLRIEVTEAWPPTVNHKQGCHKIGTCVDARPPKTDLTPEKIKKSYEALVAAGTYVELETNDANLIKGLKEIGYTGVILQLPYPTHFSVYKDRQTKK